ncbi:hypothetical protein EDD18DRAFT_1412802 [Armillaria luteobubalina]|uniref:Uncharacterized protein n=1 Tax=Armillaria luteobubalina TaxID=153913 RepID=A0AA39QJY6_9AGAR|nr:hypothetical protein EDD18DRAFT_1412802 [Armillaria luteobubalina]
MIAVSEVLSLSKLLKERSSIVKLTEVSRDYKHQQLTIKTINIQIFEKTIDALKKKKFSFVCTVERVVTLWVVMYVQHFGKLAGLSNAGVQKRRDVIYTVSVPEFYDIKTGTPSLLALFVGNTGEIRPALQIPRNDDARWARLISFHMASSKTRFTRSALNASRLNRGDLENDLASLVIESSNRGTARIRRTTFHSS